MFLTMSTLVVCMGAAFVDDLFTCRADVVPGTSNPAHYERFAGGVARNVAHHLSNLGCDVELISHFGTDEAGQWLMHDCDMKSIRYRHSSVSNLPTGRYAAILNPDGQLFTAACADSLELALTPEYLESKVEVLRKASLLMADCNLSVASISWLLDFGHLHQIPLVIEPVSVAKAGKLSGLNLSGVLLITPGEAELESILKGTTLQSLGIRYVWVRKGKNGSDLFSSDGYAAFPAPEVEVVNTNGAGDAAMAGWIFGWLGNKTISACILTGHALAGLTLQSKSSVPELTDEFKQTITLHP